MNLLGNQAKMLITVFWIYKMKQDFSLLGKAVIEIEIKALHKLIEHLDINAFNQACKLLLDCKGRVIVMGIGKSGHIGDKIAATLASTGTPAFFVHAAEAAHGDLGMVMAQDVIIALSYSGTTQEVINIIPPIKQLNTKIIALTGNKSSPLAQAADVFLNVYVEEEACPLNLAPTASTTTMLVLGDALAIALLQAKGFTSEDFARSHPGGSLGKRLWLKVEDLMHKGEATPKVGKNTLLHNVLIEISEKKLGMAAIVNADNQVIGIFTDGDLRRALSKNADIYNIVIENIMTKNPKTITKEKLAIEALQVMQENAIQGLLVVDENNRIQGALHMHDLLRAGVG